LDGRARRSGSSADPSSPKTLFWMTAKNGWMLGRWG
jgi:hypothetical protein